MTSVRNEGRLCKILQSVPIFLVEQEQRDFPMRQLSEFLVCYQCEDAQTVRGFASRLNIPRSSVTRALDRLEELQLARREVETADRRSVTVQRTSAGYALMRKIESMLGGPTAGKLTTLDSVAGNI